MRQYLFVFWSLVLCGMALLTAMYTASPRWLETTSYRVYDTEGQVIYTGSNPADAGIPLIL